MENWGLITFRNTLLLRTNTTSQSELEGIVSVIIHEIAHMHCGFLK
jgi:aminopeptidase N